MAQLQATRQLGSQWGPPAAAPCSSSRLLLPHASRAALPARVRSSSSSSSSRRLPCSSAWHPAAAVLAPVQPPNRSSSSSSARPPAPHLLQRRPRQQQRATAAAAAEPAGAGDVQQQQLEPHQQQQQQVEQQQQQQQPPLQLPPSRSVPAWLAGLGDSQLAQAAADWGYTQVGRPLPEGLSVSAIADTIPDAAFQLSLPKALGYMALSLGVMAAGYGYLWYWHGLAPLWQQLACWLVIGTGYFGAFQTAVDCSRFAFWPSRPAVQDVLGAVLMAPALVSYEVWRLKLFNHLMCTNQLYEDTDAWQPLLPADLAGLPAWRGALLRLVMATPLKFFASVGQWLRSLEGFDLRLHPEDARGWVLASWLPPLAFAGLAWPAMVAAGGVGGWVSWWLGPWLVFHGWTSVLSLAAHTGPHITWAEEGLSYDHAQATINGTVTLQLPAWLEVLLHHANYHLAAHMSISIPSYNLEAAHAYLQQRLGAYMTLGSLNPTLLRRLLGSWHVYDEARQTYVDFDAAEQLVQQYEQKAQQQAQQQQQPAAAASSVGGSGTAPSSSSSSSNGTHSAASAAEQQQQAQQPVGRGSSSPAPSAG